MVMSLAPLRIERISSLKPESMFTSKTEFNWDICGIGLARHWDIGGK
jgi:hypothetical protein